MYNSWFLGNEDEIILKLTNFNEGVEELEMIEWFKYIAVPPYCSFA